MDERVCEGCRACCFGLQVEDLEKPGFQHCDHECEEGCGIYGDHPKACQDFKCGWLEGLTAAGISAHDLRPDRIGLVPVLQNTKGGSAWTLFEVRAGASKTALGETLIDHLYRQAPVCVMTKEGRRWIVHPRHERVARTLQKAEESFGV